MGNSQSEDEKETVAPSRPQKENIPKPTPQKDDRQLNTLESQMKELLDGSDASSHNSLAEKSSAEPPASDAKEDNTSTPNYPNVSTQLSPELIERAERVAKEAAEKAAYKYLQEIQGYGNPQNPQIMEQATQVALVAYQQSLAHSQQKLLEEQNRAQKQPQQSNIPDNVTANKANLRQQSQVITEEKSDASQPIKNNASETSDQMQNQDDMASIEKFPISFKWKYGGRDVYVAHSGDGFRLKHHMEKVDVQLFEVTLELPPGEYSYKYIVDNTWRCDPDTKKVKDEATGKWYNVVEVGESTAVEEARTKESEGQYGQFIKDEQDYIRDPPTAPPQLGYILLNQQPERGFHPLILPEPSHVTINHLYMADKREEEVVTLGLTERFKNKFVTTVYYKPIDSRGEMEGSNMNQNVILDYSR